MVDQQGRAASLSDSLQCLRSAQKSSRGAPVYSLVVNRPLGRLFAALAHQAGLSPNQVSAISATCTLAGIGLLALLPPNWLTALLVTAALVAGYALDAADGQLARLRGGGTLAGEWLDHVIDSVKIATLHLAVLINIYRFFSVDPAWLFIPLLFCATYVVHFFGMLLTDLLSRLQSSTNSAVSPNGTQSSLMSILKLPTDYGVLCISFLLLAVPKTFLLVYTALAIAMSAYTLLVLPRWYARIDRLEYARRP
jgi:phosphatidylglycerophosphate synthase